MAYPYEEFESDSAAAARNAALHERENCARIAESFYKDYPPEVRHMAKRIAEVIRRQPPPR
jgi:hypothetical protein